MFIYIFNFLGSQSGEPKIDFILSLPSFDIVKSLQISLQVNRVILNGFDVEIDIWVINSEIFLGHDFSQFKIDKKFLIDNKNKLWIHAKNDQALFFLSRNEMDLNFFWHEGDKKARLSER